LLSLSYFLVLNISFFILSIENFNLRLEFFKFKMNIALIGFRGIGKTTIAKLLAKKLDKRLISTDEEVVKRIKTTIQKYIQKYGWNKFREVESEVIDIVSCSDECVFDTGVNIVMRNENIINLKKNALIIFLTADAKTITNRIKSINGISTLIKFNYINEIKEIFHGHEHRYKNAADYTIDTSNLSPEEICDLIIHYVQMEMQ